MERRFLNSKHPDIQPVELGAQVGTEILLADHDEIAPGSTRLPQQSLLTQDEHRQEAPYTPR